MPTQTVNQQIADEAITHAITMQRVAASLRGKVLAELKRLEASLVKEISALPGDTSIFKASVLSALLRQTRDSINGSYANIAETQEDFLTKIAATEQAKAAQIINNAIGIQAITVAMTENQIVAMIGDSLLKGRFHGEWWDKQAADLRDRFAVAMREGMFRGEGVDELVRRVRGTKAAGFGDGIMAASRAKAETLVRTSVQTVANESRMKTFMENLDVIKAVQWLCLAAGTLIATPDGDRPIESIQKGELVIGGTGRHRRVLETSRTVKRLMARVRLSNGAEIVCTADHKFLTATGEWMEAQHLTTDLPLAERQADTP